MTQPVDVMKTRLMNAKKGEYRVSIQNALHYFKRLTEGVETFNL